MFEMQPPTFTVGDTVHSLYELWNEKSKPHHCKINKHKTNLRLWNTTATMRSLILRSLF